MKIKPFLYGVIAGGLAAGIGTLLTAPNSGKMTRVKINENKLLVLNQFHELKSNLVQLKDSAVFATKEGKTQVSKFLSDVKVSLARWEKEIRPQQQELQRELVEMKGTVQEIEKKILEPSN